ncbi:MAG: endo-1,4-beta-xylanase, partial [Lachnospiraceae bacterium]|nr:endo-1,4-beta-xylanase [Lachnospiraceae bacterium]
MKGKMLKRVIAWFIAASMLMMCGCNANVNINSQPKLKEQETAGKKVIDYSYASKEEGIKLLMSNTAYYDGFTQNDLDYKAQKKGATMEEYLDFAKEQVLDFTDEQKARIDEMMADIEKKLDENGYTLPKLEPIVFISTTQEEECGSGAYTHGTQIYLNAEWISDPEKGDYATAVMAHEIFHCTTRSNPEFRKAMYKIINFTVVEDDYALPPSVKEYFISNPDVEHHNSYATFTINGEPVDCFAALVTTKHFENRGDSFFDCMTTALVPVDGSDTYYIPEDTSDFYDVFGENTGYVIDPEECMADNFSYAVVYGPDGMDGEPYKTPGIIEGIIDYLKNGGEESPAENSEEEKDAETTDSETAANENIIVNGDFSSDDVSMWGVEVGSGNSTITACNDPENAPEGYETYGLIERDPSKSIPFECFAQDITASLLSGVTYDYEFYVKLSDDYKDAPAEQRQVDFAPYITVNGQTNYLGSYSEEITGVSSVQLEPGVWTRFEGTFTPDFNGKLERAVIRIVEQGTDYGSGTCVLGDYCVTGVKLIPKGSAEELKQAAKESGQAVEIEKDIPDLRDYIASKDGLGEDAICGAAIGIGALSDQAVMDIIHKHFNAVTLENELKMDAMFGYNNAAYAPDSIHEEELNGEKIMVPTLDHSRADAVLDELLKWNDENPDKKIRVRGHVLVWHSQAPEWFFHEDYDASKAYVSKEVMDKRLEWYIKTMLEYYTGKDSKYKGMFYGWDVVNEAVSDSSGSYRTDEEDGDDKLSDPTHSIKSSWWHVYKGNEFIKNAFKYANKYAPADVELYYNDYNECESGKMEGILNLIKDVKNEPGTR